MGMRKAMTKRSNRGKDAYVRQILEALRREYLPIHPQARIDAYRYNPASIRVRIIDPCFEGRPITQRDDEVRQLLRRNLPEDVRADINLLLLLAPGETKKSPANLEFEDPIPAEL